MQQQVFTDQVFFSDARNMREIPSETVDLIVTSPPYFNIKDYSKDGYQITQTSNKVSGQIGDIAEYEKYIAELLKV